jgi:hypothetical protein
MCHHFTEPINNQFHESQAKFHNGNICRIFNALPLRYSGANKKQILFIKASFRRPPPQGQGYGGIG